MVAQTGCPGSIFIRIEDSDVDPVHLVDRVMEQARTAGRSPAPHVVRMIPVQTTCSARTTTGIAEAATPFVQASLRGYTGSYAVHWRRRYNSEVDKMAVINALAAVVSSVAPDAKVDLKHADAAMSIEVIKSLGCVSVLPRWREFQEYNLRALVSDRCDGEDASAAPKAAEGKAS